MAESNYFHPTVRVTFSSACLSSTKMFKAKVTTLTKRRVALFNVDKKLVGTWWWTESY